MDKNDIERVSPVSGGLRIFARNGTSVVLRFSDFERLRNATESQRLDFRVSFGGLRWDSLDEDVSLDSVFSPESFPMKLSGFSALLNMSEVARRLDIPQPLFAAYVSGAKKPSAAREKRILAEIAKVGREMAEVAG